MSESSNPNKHKRKFLPAQPSFFVIRAAQELVKVDFQLRNRLHVSDQDLQILRDLPRNCGITLTSNHADETDPKVCIELSRRSRRRFISMCNREAFDEDYGLAGFALQRLGYFSVERGAHDANAKVFAIDVLKNGSDILVIFPEGEIFYLNELVQPFHSGAIELSMQAILDKRKTDPKWTACIVPMAIKYHYDSSVQPILQRRIERMESALSLIPTNVLSLPERIFAIQKVLLQRRESVDGINLDGTAEDLQQEIVAVRRKLLATVEEKYHESLNLQKRTIDESWRLGAELREQIEEQEDTRQLAELHQDLAKLEEVAQLVSWNPRYYEGTTSFDRMAEAVMKLERELYRIKRPPQLANRNVFVKISEPIDLGLWAEAYVYDARSVRKKLTDQLQEQVQGILDSLSNPTV